MGVLNSLQSPVTRVEGRQRQRTSERWRSPATGTGGQLHRREMKGSERLDPFEERVGWGDSNKLDATGLLFTCLYCSQFALMHRAHSKVLGPPAPSRVLW